jgi:hypothetical protein
VIGILLVLTGRLQPTDRWSQQHHHPCAGICALNERLQPITNSVLVIPIRFSDSPGDSFNGAAINTEFQTRVAPYYQEVSYGQQLLNITVGTTTVFAGCAGRTDANGWLQ